MSRTGRPQKTHLAEIASNTKEINHTQCVLENRNEFYSTHRQQVYPAHTANSDTQTETI